MRLRSLLLLVLFPLLVSAPEDDRRVLSIDSAILGETRTVRIALPASFGKTAPSRRYPLIVVTDGEGPSAEAVVTASRELSRHGLMPETIVAGIENTDRLRDLTPPGISVSGSSRGEGGDRFLDFIERELVPALEAQYRAAAPRVLAGHSSGGILATYAGATRDAFRLIVALDTPVHLEDRWLAAKLVARARAGGAPVRYASYNAVFGWPDAAWAELTAAAPDSWVLRHGKFENETHNSMPMLGAYLGLRELFADYSRKAAPVFPTTSILPYYDTLTAKYGAPLAPPQPLMRDVVDDLLLEGRGAAARAAFDALIAAYGEPPNASETRAQIEEVSSRPEPTETVESLLATPMATAEEAAPYVGEWRAESRRGAYTRTRFTLTIGIEDGRVKGHVLWKFAPGEELRQELQYFTVQPGGFTYGFMNGMRPRGMLLYPMQMNGADEASGTMRWGGVQPPTHEGRSPPPELITLHRVR